MPQSQTTVQAAIDIFGRLDCLINTSTRVVGQMLEETDHMGEDL
jgi:hypothetical protein